MALANGGNDYAANLYRQLAQETNHSMFWYNLAVASNRAGKVDEAISSYEMAAKLGDMDGAGTLGDLYFIGGDWELGRAWMKKAQEYGIPEAAERLGFYDNVERMTVHGNTQSALMYVELAKMSASVGNDGAAEAQLLAASYLDPGACLVCARFLEAASKKLDLNGNPTPLGPAVMAYRRAASQGQEDAISWLRNLGDQ